MHQDTMLIGKLTVNWTLMFSFGL